MAFETIQSLGIINLIQVITHVFVIIKYHDFVLRIQLLCWNVFIVCVAPTDMNLKLFFREILEIVYSQKRDKNSQHLLIISSLF